jgi:hypothetical protein
LASGHSQMNSNLASPRGRRAAIEVDRGSEQLAAELQLKRELAMHEMQMTRGWPGDGPGGVSGVYVGGEPG